MNTLFTLNLDLNLFTFFYLFDKKNGYHILYTYNQFLFLI